MANIGYVAIVLALIASIYSAITYMLAPKIKSSRILESARNSLISVMILVSISVLILLYAIFSHDFGLEYVYSYTSIDSSPLYLLSALWAGNSGSLLFWAWLLSIFSVIVFFTRRGEDKELIPYAAMVLMITQAFFLILLVAVMNPFNTNASIEADGLGLNPILQNLGMVFHPPALLAGYVGFTVPFAFGIACLILGKSGDEWLLSTRKWMLFAWLLLGIGNIIGMWWAYVELGWGGYWAWDPVENAGLMPWLIATAFLHSSIIQRRKGVFKIWNLFLIILAFCLVMFGTFLTRSGLLSSVHTFNDSGLGPYFVVFIGIALFGSLGLLYYRSDDLKRIGNENLISKESTFLLNNILLVGSTLVILIGTVFPAISEAIRGVKLSLNASFFNTVNGPLFLLIILLAGICTLIAWKTSSLRELVKKIIWPFVVAFATAIIIFIFVIKDTVPILAFFVCAFTLFGIVNEFINGARVRHKLLGSSYISTWITLIWSNSQRYGGYIVHAGIVLMAIGVIGSSFYSTDKEEILRIGDSIDIRQYTVTYKGLDFQTSANKDIYTANLEIYKSGVLWERVISEKYIQRGQSVTEVGIHSNLIEDVYIILQGWSESGTTANFKIMVNPLVSWIWIGGGVFLLGGMITFWPSRRKNSKVADSNTLE